MRMASSSMTARANSCKGSCRPMTRGSRRMPDHEVPAFDLSRLSGPKFGRARPEADLVGNCERIPSVVLEVAASGLAQGRHSEPGSTRSRLGTVIQLGEAASG